MPKKFAAEKVVLARVMKTENNQRNPSRTVN